MVKLYEHTLQKQLAEQNEKIAGLEEMMRQLLAQQGAASSSGKVEVTQGDHCTATVGTVGDESLHRAEG